MMWILGFALWWTFDDTLAGAIGNPGLGALPWWVVLLAALALHMACGADIEERIKSLQAGREKKACK
tara:strand:+ start:978 stop:1178 length:201 start_codon:yes stop_codon:yes gene_type:complete